jgi:hypothetical protein
MINLDPRSGECFPYALARDSMELRHVSCSARVMVDTYDRDGNKILSLRTRECPIANYVGDPSPPHMRSQRNSTYRSISLDGSCQIAVVSECTSFSLHSSFHVNVTLSMKRAVQGILSMNQAFSAAFGVHNEIRGEHTCHGQTFQPCPLRRF